MLPISPSPLCHHGDHLPRHWSDDSPLNSVLSFSDSYFPFSSVACASVVLSFSDSYLPLSFYCLCLRVLVQPLVSVAVEFTSFPQEVSSSTSPLTPSLFPSSIPLLPRLLFPSFSLVTSARTSSFYLREPVQPSVSATAEFTSFLGEVSSSTSPLIPLSRKHHLLLLEPNLGARAPPLEGASP